MFRWHLYRLRPCNCSAAVQPQPPLLRVDTAFLRWGTVSGDSVTVLSTDTGIAARTFLGIFSRRTPRHKVIALTQEKNILKSGVQFCIWLSQWLGMTVSPVQSWRLKGAGHHPAIPQTAGDVQPKNRILLQSHSDRLHGNPWPVLYTWA